MLLFESLDGDKEDRMVSPIYLTLSDVSDKAYKNLLNSFMDHEWDGFYTGQHRLSRFPGVVKSGKTLNT